MMIASLIFVVSIAVLLQFFFSYSRSIIAAYRKSELSEQVREMVGVQGQQVASEEFVRLTQLVRLCPQPTDDQMDLKVIGLYYRILGLLRSTTRSFAPQIFKWAEQERMDCAYFVAVALDRRIAHSRQMIAQQMSQQ